MRVVLSLIISSIHINTHTYVGGMVTEGVSTQPYVSCVTSAKAKQINQSTNYIKMISFILQITNKLED